MKKNTIFFLLFSLFIGGCGDNKSYFNGEISFFEDFLSADSLQGCQIRFDDIFTGDMYVCDSLIGFHSSKYPDSYLYVFSLNSHQYLTNFFRKGDGPDEFHQLTGFHQYNNKGNDIRVWMKEIMSEKFFLLNITQSIEERKTVLDTVLDLRWTNSRYFPPNSFSFFLNEEEIIIKNQSYKKNLDLPDYIPPAYCIYNIPQKIKVADIVLYIEPLIFENEHVWFGSYFHSIDLIKPDQTKLVMAMNALCQINILDIVSKKQRGYRMKGTPDFNDLKKLPDNMMEYYIDVCVDDDYIYAFYSERRISEDPYIINTTDEVHVFDWDGKPIRKIILSNEGNCLRLDAVHKKLYVKNHADEVFWYDVGYLYND